MVVTIFKGRRRYDFIFPFMASPWTAWVLQKGYHMAGRNQRQHLPKTAKQRLCSHGCSWKNLQGFERGYRWHLQLQEIMRLSDSAAYITRFLRSYFKWLPYWKVHNYSYYDKSGQTMTSRNELQFWTKKSAWEWSSQARFFPQLLTTNRVFPHFLTTKIRSNQVKFRQISTNSKTRKNPENRCGIGVLGLL